MNNLAILYQAQGQLVRAETIWRETLAKVRKRNEATSTQIADALASLGENLLKQQKYVEAEALLRDSLTIREQKRPDDWKTFDTKSMLGGSLLGQKKHADAEHLLLAGYEGMRERDAKVPARNRLRLMAALERLVQLYDAWGKPDKAAEWRAKQK
jgi:hypothetical protein